MFASPVTQMPAALKQMTQAKKFGPGAGMDCKLDRVETTLGPLFSRVARVRLADVDQGDLERLSICLAEILVRITFRQRSNVAETVSFLERLAPGVSSSTLKACASLFSTARLANCEPYLIAKFVSGLDQLLAHMAATQTPEGSPTNTTLSVLSPSKRSSSNNVILGEMSNTGPVAKQANGKDSYPRAQTLVRDMLHRYGKENIGSQLFVSACDAVSEVMAVGSQGGVARVASTALLKDAYDLTLSRLDDTKRSDVERTIEAALSGAAVDVSTVRSVEVACRSLADLLCSLRTSPVFVEVMQAAEDIMKERVYGAHDILRPIQ